MNRTLENPKLYSITITPPYRLIDPLYLYNDDLPILVRWFRSFSKHYILYTEFDDTSRIHYHGTIQVHDLIKYHRTKYRIQKSIGFVKLKLLKTPLDLLRWTFYVRKDYYMNYKLFPFIIHHHKNKIKRVDFHNNPITIMECFLKAKQGEES